MLCSQKILEKLSRRFKGLFHFFKRASVWGVTLADNRDWFASPNPLVSFILQSLVLLRYHLSRPLRRANTDHVLHYSTQLKQYKSLLEAPLTFHSGALFCEALYQSLSLSPKPCTDRLL
jgi:hypothetical protein